MCDRCGDPECGGGEGDIADVAMMLLDQLAVAGEHADIQEGEAAVAVQSFSTPDGAFHFLMVASRSSDAMLGVEETIKQGSAGVIQR